MPQSYNRRAYGCAVIKSVNSNYNANFTHQPRTLPDGTVYATDKVLKYSIKNYLLRLYPEEKIFFFKRQNERLVPNTLLETYTLFFGAMPQIRKVEKPKKGKAAAKATEAKSKDGIPGGEARTLVLNNLLSCLDVRLFGATFAPKATKVGESQKTNDGSNEGEEKASDSEEGKGLNLSIHGSVQISHGVNRLLLADKISTARDIFSEQIMSPFRNPDTDNYESTMTTLGMQSRLLEGHYVHHFSVNPQNLAEHVQRAGEGATGLTTDDVEKLKEALKSGVTFYDSASKAGTENELLLWVELKEGSKLVLPSLVELVEIVSEDSRRKIDLAKVSELLNDERVAAQIARVELYYHKAGTEVLNAPTNAVELPLL